MRISTTFSSFLVLLDKIGDWDNPNHFEKSQSNNSRTKEVLGKVLLCGFLSVIVGAAFITMLCQSSPVSLTMNAMQAPIAADYQSTGVG